MQTAKDPYTCLSINLSECYTALDSDPTFVEMLARVLYHTTLNCFYITGDGKYHQDMADYTMLMDAIWSFASKSACQQMFHKLDMGSF